MPEIRVEHKVIENERQTRRIARMGLWFFTAYLLLYGTFVFLSAFAPSVMERELVAGLNLAIAYGIGLIVAALVLAICYSWLCRNSLAAHDQKERR